LTAFLTTNLSAKRGIFKNIFKKKAIFPTMTLQKILILRGLQEIAGAKIIIYGG